MPEIRAFRGWRYNPSRIDDFSKVVAPPYDVISARQQKALYEDNPYNVIRATLNGLEATRRPSEIAAKRGKSSEEITE